MKKIFSFLGILLLVWNLGAQTVNTSPLPAGETIIGGHLHVGAGNEVWTDAGDLYFNYRGSASKTHFWNLEGGTGKSIMTLLSNGNVGVGNSQPGFRLDIEGWGARLKNPSISPNSYTTLRIQGGQEFEHGLEIDFFGNPNIPSSAWAYGGGYGTAAIVNVNPKPLVLGTSNSPRLFITGDGNVLIGKTSQTGTRYKLDVEGPIRAHEIVVNTTGADFVFDPAYKLRPLSELETFIRTNKHLPDIAPAKEMQENGVSAGEMQAKLLQKVEELTLYVIEKDKEIVTLKAENQKQLEEQKKINEKQYVLLLELRKELENLKK